MPRIGSSVAAPQLEVRDLRVVIALGTARTTAAAAKILHITQSAVSRALTLAEEHAGAALFERTSRGLIPTDAGLVVLDAAPTMLAQLATLERRVRAPSPEPARIRLVAECYMAYPWLAQVALCLREATPEVRFELPSELSATAPAALAAGDVDFALITSKVPPGISSVSLFEDELVFLVSRDHALATAACVEYAELERHTLLVPTANAADRWFLREVFGARRVRLRVQRFPITEALVEFARAGLGVAVLSEWVAAPYLARAGSELRAVRLVSGPLMRAWRLAYRPESADHVDLVRDAVVGARPARRVPL